jgi:hypothetical protein
MTEGAAPTPFTAHEIREGCPPGRETRLRLVTMADAPTITVNRFVNTHRDGGQHETWTEDEAGMRITGPKRSEFRWTDLQAHASFPAASTDIEVETITTELGTFECDRYVVTSDNSVSTFWFAKDLPGLPIRFNTVTDDQTVVTATLISNTMPH